MKNENNNTNITVTDSRRGKPTKKYKIEGFNITDAAAVTNIDHETVRKIIKVHKSENGKTKNKGGKVTSAKESPEIENFIETLIKTNNQITIEQIKSKIAEYFNVNACVETVRRCIYKLGVALKVAARILENVYSTVSKDRRWVHASEFLANDAHGENINVFLWMKADSIYTLGERWPDRDVGTCLYYGPQCARQKRITYFRDN